MPIERRVAAAVPDCRFAILFEAAARKAAVEYGDVGAAFGYSARSAPGTACSHAVSDIVDAGADADADVAALGAVLDVRGAERARREGKLAAVLAIPVKPTAQKEH